MHLLLSVAWCDIFYCPHLYYAVSCSRCIKKRKSVPDQSFALSHHTNSCWGATLVSFSCISHGCYTAMIREKAIFIKLSQLKYSDRQLFDTAVASFKPSSCSCPKCGAVGSFSRIRPYRRFLISAEHSSRSDTELIVPRFRCGGCGCTHALLPDSLIPFGSYSLRFILTVLLAYLTRSGTVADFCDHWQIAISTLYRWIHLFRSHFNSWCSILDRILWITQKSLASVSAFPAFPSDFLARFGFSFLQGHRASPSVSLPQTDRRRRSWIT